MLDRRAIENYFPERAIKWAVGSRYSALSPYELLGANHPAWSKRENWRIADHMRKDDLVGTDLGAFLETFA
jgi:hypothetical protein